MKTREQAVRDSINARIPSGGTTIEVMETDCNIAAISWSKREQWKCLAKLNVGKPYASTEYVWYTVSPRQIGEIRAALGETGRMPANA